MTRKVTIEVIGSFLLLLSNMTATGLNANVSGASLSMKWIHAEASHVNGRNEIKWTTGDERNCKDYVVEKSINGSEWQALASPISAINTTDTHNYQLIDPAVSASVTWYRIRQTDNDKKISYSVILIVQTGKGIMVHLYPNPVSKQFTITSGQPIRSVNVYNVGDVMLYTKNTGGLNYHTVNSSEFIAGHYYAVIQLEDGNVVKEYFTKQ